MIRLPRISAALLSVGVALAALPAGAADPANPGAADPVVAQRGSVVVTVSDVRELLRTLDPDQRRDLERDPAKLGQRVRELLLQQVLLAEAHATQFDQRPEVLSRAEFARQAAITEAFVGAQSQVDPAYPSEDEIAAAYEANKSKLLLPRQYHVAQIFISVPAGAAKTAEDDAAKRAQDARTQAARPKADFASLAKRLSEERTSAGAGGDMGWVREDQLVPAIRTALAGLPEGSVSDPVRGPGGWHVLKLLGTRPAAPAPLPDVRDALVRALRQDKRTQNERAYIAGLLKTQPLQVNEIELSKLGVR